MSNFILPPSGHGYSLKLLNEHEVALIIRKSVYWLRRKRCKGDPDSIPYRKLGHSVRYVESDVLHWIERHTLQTSTNHGGHSHG